MNQTNSALDSIRRLHEQVTIGLQGWSVIAKELKRCNRVKPENIILMGMGGSAIGPHLVQSVFAGELTIPFQIVNGYELPGYASKKSLVVFSSFSGGTEEVLAAYKQATKKNLPRFVICAGGELARLAKKDSVGLYEFDPSDLAPQPRYGVGFSVMATLGVLRGLGLVRISSAEVEKIIQRLKDKQLEKTALRFAKAMQGSVPVLVAAEHLQGALHIMQNQLHETGKQFAVQFSIPELNHHLMEGLGAPKEVVKKLHFLFVDSALYGVRIKKRFALTQTVVKKNGARSSRFLLSGKTALEQAFELIGIGGFLAYALATKRGIDPVPQPWVDWFKREMSK